MGKLFEQFLAYYNSASAQQKKADWDEFLRKLDAIMHGT